MFQHYIESLNKIIRVSIDLTDLDEHAKNALESQINETVLRKSLADVESYLTREDFVEIARVSDGKENPTGKNFKILQLMEKRVTKEQFSRIMLRELEDMAKSIIDETAQTLKGESKDLYLDLVSDLLDNTR